MTQISIGKPSMKKSSVEDTDGNNLCYSTMDEDDQNTVSEAASKPSQERKNVKKKMTQDLMPNEIE